MRLATWNCAGGFHKKIGPALSLGADVLVIQECAAPEKWRELLPSGSQVWWRQEGDHKGIAVIAGAGYELADHPAALEGPAFRHIHPLVVSGPAGDEFTLFAVWTMHVASRKDGYIAQLWDALDAYESIIDEHTVIAGDWNSHPQFDSTRALNHTAVRMRLEASSIYSAYHWQTGCSAGEELHPTHFFRFDEAAPFHLDYIFASKVLLDGLEEVAVGRYVDGGRSATTCRSRPSSRRQPRQGCPLRGTSSPGSVRLSA